VALGAPCFFEEDAEVSGVGDSLGVPVADGVSDGEGDLAGVSNGSGSGKVFFFRCGDALGEGASFFFFGLGDGDSDSVAVAETFFFRVDGVTVGDGDSSSINGDCFFFGEGVGVGDVLFVVAERFLFRGFGVGVGVEKIFLRVPPRDCSAAAAAGASGGTVNARTIRIRISILGVLTGDA